MSDPIITVENLSKRYSLRHEAKAPYRTLREALAGQARRLFSTRKPDSHSHTREDFWALRDVNFSIERGDVVGIIGRNGAGKSTLLKILSRITEPTTGRIRLGGRVASLLEVGTGFHPELTGRENIFLNGAILGMTKAEIRSKFDEIVAFAEVEKFLDTPVKHYSSGMYVRLAFAVAAHLEPEVLIVDEVLAVGDAHFQRKCLGKMQDVAENGRTVVFVSHQLDMVDRLTKKTIWLAKGNVEAYGDTPRIIGSYLSTMSSDRDDLSRFRVRRALRGPSIASVVSVDLDGVWRPAFRQGEEFCINVALKADSGDATNVDVAVVIENERDQSLFTSHLTDSRDALEITTSQTASVKITPALLRTGHYKVSVAVFAKDGSVFYDVIHHLPLFEIAGSMEPCFPNDRRWGDLFFSLPWSVKHA